MQFVAIGVIAGILSGLFGIGGGVIIVPALILIYRMQPQMATGTSLGALLLPVGVLGAYLGAQLALHLPPRVLQRVFAVFLVVIAAYLWLKA